MGNERNQFRHSVPGPILRQQSHERYGQCNLQPCRKLHQRAVVHDHDPAASRSKKIKPADKKQHAASQKPDLLHCGIIFSVVAAAAAAEKKISTLQTDGVPGGGRLFFYRRFSVCCRAAAKQAYKDLI